MEPKKTLFVNLSQKTAEMQLLPELTPCVGGVTLGVKLYSLYKDFDPVVICVGPLNGFFPFASKTCFVVQNDGVMEDLYIGGGLSFRLKFACLDALVLAGSSSEDVILDITNDEVKFLDAQTDLDSLGLPGKRSILHMKKDSLLLDGYFGFDLGILEKKFLAKKIFGFSVTGTKKVPILGSAKYMTLFNDILGQKELVNAQESNCPSCSGCPLGCDKSQTGEMGGNILVHSLVACGYAENIYSNLGMVFACLDCLGYKYTHEQLEALPDLFTKTLKEIS
ncbi:MAG: aldehyde ferredoxin oxidoreductase N-terminal domain-containing protein [Patescibacteria group bacterium]